MKSFTARITLVTVVFFFFSFFSVAHAEEQVRLLLNNGEAAGGLTCNAADMTRISQRFDWTNLLMKPSGRNLRGMDHAEFDSYFSNISKNEQREMVGFFYPNSCKNSCKGFATGTCLARACIGYRRRELQNPVVSSSGDWCAYGTDILNMFLDDLVKYNKVSVPCMELLTKPRSIDCLYNVIC